MSQVLDSQLVANKDTTNKTERKKKTKQQIFVQFHKIKRLVLLDETRRDERSQENWSLYREVERSQIWPNRFAIHYHTLP